MGRDFLGGIGMVRERMGGVGWLDGVGDFFLIWVGLESMLGMEMKNYKIVDVF